MSLVPVNESQIQAQFTKLSEQRNNALNDCVNLTGSLAIANAKVTELEAQVAELEAKLPKVECELSTPVEVVE